MARFLPADSMGLVRRVLGDVVTPNRGTFLSFGILGTLWAASGGFAAIIEALDTAYQVKDDRPFWKTRPLAVGLVFIVGALVLISLSVMVVGPRFGEWLAGRIHLSGLFVLLWPYIHWTIAVGLPSSRLKLSISSLPMLSSVSLPHCPEQFFRWAAGSACRMCSALIFATSAASTKPMERSVPPLR